MKTIICLMLAFGMALAIDPAVPFAGVAWGGAAATALTGALSGGKVTPAMQISASLALYGMAGVYASGSDAGLHYITSAGLFGAGYLGLRRVMRPWQAAGLSGLGVLAIGAGKELYDSRQPGNRWDWNDMKWNVIGVASSAAISLGCEWLGKARWWR